MSLLQKKQKETADGILFILPATVIIGVFVLFPTLRLVYLSLCRANLMGRTSFQGINNYLGMFGSHDFWLSFRVTLKFMVWVVIFQTGIAFLASLLVNSEGRATAVLRTVYFIPVIISFVVVGYLWKGLFNHDFGLINAVLSTLGIRKQGFLSDPTQALASLTIASVWKSWPYFMMIFLAGLKEIPGELYESARIDGAGWGRQLVSLTIPLLRRTTLFVLVITTMDSVVKVFTPVFVMTSGGPRGETDMIVHYAWRMAFRMGNLGQASAITIFIFLFLAIVSLVQMKIGEKDE
jgi:ABC-type sugar transport system permease subunit